MNTYITHKRPSWRTAFLGLIGVTDLPIRVNCWYCNYDSYLLPGGKHTERHWYCSNCENTNMKDENGEIVDWYPAFSGKSKCQLASSPRRDNIAKPNSRGLCKSCTKNQSLIYQLASDYDRDVDDDDPRAVTGYRESLDRKYPLCEDCQAKVDTLLAEQRSEMRQRRFHEKLSQSLETKPPKRQSLPRFIAEGFLWTALHSLIILTCLYASLIPPNRHTHSWETFWLDVRGTTQHAVESAYNLIGQWKASSYSTIVCAVLLYMLQALGSFLVNTPRVTGNLLQCVSTPDMSHADCCEWSFSTFGSFLFLVTVPSIAWMNWHPRVSRSFIRDSSRLKFWSLYKATQVILYIARIGLTAVLYFMDDREMLMDTMNWAWMIYTSTLLLSVVCVRIPPTQWPTRQVGYKKAVTSLQKSCSNLQTFATSQASKIGRYSMDAAQYLTPQTSVDSLSDVPHTKPSPKIDHELDDLVTGIHKIGF